MKDAAPWGPLAVPAGETTSVAVGPLVLRLRRLGAELWIGVRSTPETAGAAGPASEGSWTRWALPPEGEAGVHLAPALPDRLLVVKPRPPFHLAPGAEARVYVRVPIWVQVRLGGAAGALLGEFPTVPLSDTWWGDMADGSLGYWLDSSARRSFSADLVQPHLAVCAMDLSNRSREALPVEKVALRVVHLSVFRSDAGLWCEEVRVRYQGGEESHLEMSGRPPEEAEGAELVAPPRIPAERGLRARTFARLMGGGPHG